MCLVGLTPRFERYQSAIHLNGREIGASNQPGYNLLNARLSYDFWDDHAQVALWAKNLADQEYIVYSTPSVSSFGTVVNFTGLPRTWGAENSYRFWPTRFERNGGKSCLPIKIADRR